jgi:hypothetical protein
LEIVGEVGEVAVFYLAGGAMQDEEAAGVSLLGGFLGDKVLREMIVEKVLSYHGSQAVLRAAPLTARW